MEAIDSYKDLGLLSFCLLLFGLVFVILRWPQSKHLSLSHYVAQKKLSIIYYSLLFWFALPILITFFIIWFSPMFALPPAFNLLILTASVTQIACTLIPEIGGWKQNIIEFWLAYLLYAYFLPCLLLLLPID